MTEYPVAAKTGTSQKWMQATGSYSHDRFIASYVGLAPYENPELCLLVVIDEPWPSYYGGTAAAPVFREIMKEALPLLDVPPSDAAEAPPNWPRRERARIGAPGVLADYTGANFVRRPIPKGDKGASGPIPGFAEARGLTTVSASLENEPEADPVRAVPTPGVMPDVRGLSMREVLDLLAPAEMSLEYVGSGLAVSQDPPPGAGTSQGQLARVVFAGR
jgi:hypothetical protein